MIITISGKAGSGKSTVAKKLATKLNLTHYSIGDLMRSIAKKRGISLMELSKLAEADDSIDLELDKKQISLKDMDNFVIDGRLTAFFIPKSDIRVFLDCEDKVRADRILREGRRDEGAEDIDELIGIIRKREESEKKRYKEIYNVNYLDQNLYNLKIDTTNLTADQVVQKISENVKKLQNV
jgi:CMP/dCMP kinase